MTSVMQRVQAVKQPRGGYVATKLFNKIQLDDNKILSPNESTIKGNLFGITVDYFTRFLLGADKEVAWSVSLMGAKMINQQGFAEQLLNQITGLNPESIQAAYRLAGFDVVKRGRSVDYRDVNSSYFTLSSDEMDDITIMIERVQSFFKNYGHPIDSGMTFNGGYTDMINTGDADYITEDTLWDLKTVRGNVLSKDYKLQLLVYYLMGLHSFEAKNYVNIKYLGIFNPRNNVVYRCPINKIPESVIDEVKTVVIGY
ncbi:hypothetical protein [Nicoliella lavandulae]|uniref:PD-(D/E)XK endonuclease-like domain-containing protein n=1 Tax=Nicoliella lavandulae TaxID=3082954 RepID=A0ABU8SLX9_9LACO